MIYVLGKRLPLDYLWISEFSMKECEPWKDVLQMIHYFQEQLEYSNIYVCPALTEYVTGKVFVIDDREYSTMLWAEEY